ncbi:MAG: MazF family transcriptional regulator [Candidatus Magnetoglobus multicellularis str. Araruama]|uniref:MazF family transcriptional regulator n=1 Tax=Candidatus Magnetoglobus multicellularis str. Araruama TaxID=890399 RepID=A0A1V1NX55_9BACT|nr:MAG: MazF family transcriptional regulator [Candidatus Magnetoglobus multicellularis str. Araruama]
MQRGEVWWADLPSPMGRRPVLLLSRNEAYEVRNAITVAQITTTIRNIPVEVKLGSKDGLPKKCVVNLDTIATIKKNLVTEKIVMLSKSKIIQVDAAVKFVLSLS